MEKVSTPMLSSNIEFFFWKLYVVERKSEQFAVTFGVLLDFQNSQEDN